MSCTRKKMEVIIFCDKNVVMFLHKPNYPCSEILRHVKTNF